MGRPKTHYELSTKVCENCGAEYHRKHREHLSVWERRKYCSQDCSQRGQTNVKRDGIRNRLGHAQRAADIEERLVNLTEFGGYSCPLGGGVWSKFGKAMGA